MLSSNVNFRSMNGMIPSITIYILYQMKDTWVWICVPLRLSACSSTQGTQNCMWVDLYRSASESLIPLDFRLPVSSQPGSLTKLLVSACSLVDTKKWIIKRDGWIPHKTAMLQTTCAWSRILNDYYKYSQPPLILMFCSRTSIVFEPLGRPLEATWTSCI